MSTMNCLRLSLGDFNCYTSHTSFGLINDDMIAIKREPDSSLLLTMSMSATKVPSQQGHLLLQIA